MKTNIVKIRQASKLLLELPIDIDKQFGFICHHPFIRDTYFGLPCEKTQGNPVGMEMLDIRIDSNLKKVRNFYRKRIDECKKASDFFMIINKPYSGLFFKIIKEYLSNKDYVDMLELLWTSMEYPNNDVNVSQKEFISYWHYADVSKIYSKEDKKKLKELPETFIVYRGLMKGANVKALSWTLDKSKAEWFAKRFGNNGKVYKALCHKKDILVYLSCRNEEEIVVDWHNLKNIEEV